MQRSYFDHNATTPVSASVLKALVPALAEVYGNASSIHHHGQVAKQQLETARRQVACLIGCEAREIVFTSGGTEANNLAIFGAVLGRPAGKRHVVTTAIEHPAVLRVCDQLETTCVPVGSNGIVDPEDVSRAIRPNSALITVMHANNEVGTLQPIEEIAQVAQEAGVLFHVDGMQAAGKIPVNVKALGVDLYSLSGHKLYGPKGIGALYVKKRTHLQPYLFGGRHERELRPGTENVPGAVGLGQAAVDFCADEMGRLVLLRDRLESGILRNVPGTGVNGDTARRLPNTSNIYFDGFEGEAMVISLDLKGFAVSSGSACSSGAVEPSHVLMALGLSKDRAKSSIRFSLGASNTQEQVDDLIDAVAESAAHLRKLSPTYAHA